MELDVQKQGDVAVVRLSIEELDAGNAGEFKQDMPAIIEDNDKVLLNLGNLRFVDSSGLGAFLSCLRKVNARGGTLKLCELTTQVQSVFELVRMHRIFDVYPTQAAALSAFGSS